MNKEKLFHIFIENYGKILGVFLGFLFSILIICIGVIKTIFISLCVCIGYFIGNKIDHKENLLELLDKILPLGKYK
ncbi:DUF2273 domain-containing protein [Crassaminicella indica]|uniref:DUF2273 domain-containing protein n=1 Tax=Crassaminicella indica TaxID=2855394 RepID=A0ABX8RCJ4_9CLOT|nr:DUF2273 domain-containing protein [Crassaminicella indica]QXM06022.1 DUF2273 domain-containing protein [Crassaminicella indica]